MEGRQETYLSYFSLCTVITIDNIIEEQQDKKRRLMMIDHKK